MPQIEPASLPTLGCTCMSEKIELGVGSLTRSLASDVVHQRTQVETRDHEDHTFAGTPPCLHFFPLGHFCDLALRRH